MKVRNIFARRTKKAIKSGKVKVPKPEVAPIPQAVTNTEFSQYRNAAGSQIVSYELIDGLYQKTLMNRVINKIAGDCTRMEYGVSYVDLEDKLDPEIAKIGLAVDVKLTREVLRNIFRDMLKYGTAFLYVQYDKLGNPIQMYCVHPQYVTANIVDGILVGWKYNSDHEVQLLPEELIAFPLDVQTGKVFGNSAFQPIIHILELLLNSQLNSAILVDRFALPIIQWAIGSGDDETKTEPAEIMAFMQNLFDQLAGGNDIGTDDNVKPTVIGMDNNLIDFVPIIQDLKETFGIIVGVPITLIGGRGDNLSVTTRQMQSYLEMIRDLQETVADKLIEHLYKPHLLRNNIVELVNYKYILFDFPVMAVEENSKSIDWIVPAIHEGLITRTQGKNTLGFKGPAMPIDEIEQLPMPEVIRPGQRKDPSQTKEPGTKTKDPGPGNDHE